MTDPRDQQLALLKQTYGDAVVEGDVVILPRYPAPSDVWGIDSVEICIKVPPEPAIAPYGFWVRPQLIACDDIRPEDHYQCSPPPIDTDGDWGFFSWSPAAWTPEDTILAFVRSFADRLAAR